MELKKKESFLKNFLKRMDFFSVTFEFRVDNKKKYTTLCGGLFFLFYLFGIISYILKSFFDYVTFTDFKILFIDRYEDKTKIDINEYRFFYSFKFTYEEVNSTLVNPELDYDVLNSKYKELFVIDHNYVLKNIETGASNKTKIPIASCDIENIKRFDKSIPQNATFSNFYKNHICFKYQNYSIYGLYTDKIMSYIEVTLKLNSTYYSKNLETLKDIFSKVNFKFNPYYSDYIYDVSNLTNPISNRIESTLYSYVDLNYYERTNIFLNELIFKQDQNLFFKEHTNNTYIKYSNFDKSLYPILGRLDKKMTYSDKYNLIKYFIRPNMKKSVILITLIKIPEFLSGISAISTSFLVILNIIVSYFNNFKAKQKIIQKIMKYNDIIKDKNKDYFEYFLKNIKEKMPDMKEISIKNNNILSNSKNNIFDKNKMSFKRSSNNDIMNSHLSPNYFDTKKKIADSEELKAPNKIIKFNARLGKADRIDASFNSLSKNTSDNYHLNISKDEKNVYTKDFDNIHKIISPSQNTNENEINYCLKKNDINNFGEVENEIINDEYKTSTFHKRRIISKSNLSLPKQIVNFVDVKDKCTIVNENKMIKNNVNNINVAVNLMHHDKNNYYNNKEHSDKENIQTKFGSSESNINLALLNNNQNDLFIEEINKKDNINKIKDEEYNMIFEPMNDGRTVNLNANTIKNKKDNVIFDAFGKKIMQDYNKKNNIKYKNPLKITCLELFFNCFICKKEIKKKKKIFDMAEEKFNYNMDILTYLKRMLEIDILKYLILDKNLLNLMNFISKPSVSYKAEQVEYESEFKLFFNSQSPEKEINMVEIKDSFDKIIQPLKTFDLKGPEGTSKLSFIEKKMLKLFKNQIEEINK